MKKLLLSMILLAAVSVACGTSEEARKAEQVKHEAEINERVNKVLQNMEGKDVETEDSTVSDSASAPSPEADSVQN